MCVCELCEYITVTIIGYMYIYILYCNTNLSCFALALLNLAEGCAKPSFLIGDDPNLCIHKYIYILYIYTHTYIYIYRD